MNFQSYTPGFPLSKFVDSIWSMTNFGAASSRRRICPNGAMELVIHLVDQTLSFYDGGECKSVRVPVLAGPYSRSFLIDPADYASVLGIRFRPGAARVFFPVPASELHNTDIALEELYPGEAARLHDELWSASGRTEQFQVIESYLTGKLSNRSALHPAVEYALQEFLRQPGVRAIAEVQAETGFSHTRFIQIFRENVGLTPKLFCRVQRFRGVLQQIDNGRPVRWAELATACGYFDQAHLHHDFRAFAGMTPLAYEELQKSSL